STAAFYGRSKGIASNRRGCLQSRRHMLQPSQRISRIPRTRFTSCPSRPTPGGAERPSVFLLGSQLMEKVRPPRPALEVLEDRCVPAAVRLVVGNLFITNQVGAVNLTLVANNTVHVQDGTTNLTFGPVSSILFTGTDGNDV